DTASTFVITPSWTQAAKIGAALDPLVAIEVLSDDPRHFQFMHYARMNTRTEGFFVAVLEFGKEDEAELSYRNTLKGRFTVTGAAKRIVQTCAGFPTFEILILPIRPT